MIPKTRNEWRGPTNEYNIEKYACKVKDCTESYATRTELTTHRNSAHDNLDTDWPCGQCKVTCTTYKQLCTHVYRYHEYGLFACPANGCDFTEETRIKVANHQETHGPDNHQPTFAGSSSSFNMKWNLTQTMGKPFVCSQCPKAFALKNYLINHERTHSGLKQTVGHHRQPF